MLNSGLHFITAFLYALSFGLAWRFGAQGGAVDALRANSLLNLALFPVMIAGIVLHAFVLFGGLMADEGLNIGFSHAVSLIAWLSLTAYALIGRGTRIVYVAALYLVPLAALAVLLPVVLPARRVVQFGGFAFKAHVVIAILAYAMFTVATIHALLMASLERRLHAGDLPVALQGLPPLLRLERLLFQLLFVAFVMLTATLVSGVVFSDALFGKPFQFNHKTVFAVLSWLIFAGLLLGHWQFGWRGMLAVRWTLTGFVLLLLSYVGSKFVLEILLGQS